MLKCIIYYIIAFVLKFSATLGAISTWGDNPKAFPHQFVDKDVYDGRTFVVDLNNDGHDEIVLVSFPPGAPEKTHVICNSSGHRSRWQHNIHSSVTGNLHFFDLDGDGLLETLIPFTRNDSLLVRIIDPAGDHITDFFLIESQSRLDEKRSIEWDPDLIKMIHKDLDGDGHNELISIISTGLAGRPRGVMVHALESKSLIGACLIGSPPSSLYTFDDFDNDGHYELVFLTSAPGNGMQVNGLDDSHCNLVRIEFQPQPRLADVVRITDGAFSSAFGFYADFINDEQPEFITIRRSGNSEQNAQIRVFRPADFTQILCRDMDFPIIAAICFRRPKEKQSKIWVLSETNELKIINNLEVEETISLPHRYTSLSSGPDIDADGIAELVLGNSERALLISHNFKSLAIFPAFYFKSYVKNGRPQGMGYLVQNNVPELYQLERNHLFLYHRYRHHIIFSLPISFCCLLLILLMQVYRNKKILEYSFVHLFSRAGNAAVIFNAKFKAVRWNREFQEWLPTFARASAKSSLQTIFASPGVYAQIQTWIQKKTDLSLEMKFRFGRKKARDMQVNIIRLPRIRCTGRLYLATFKDLSFESEMEKAKNWKLFARRISHDIKSPLGAIVLIVQKIRTLVEGNGHDRPAVTPLLDKIEGRIESLRVMTRNFLKYADVEKPNLTNTNLNPFLEKIAAKTELGLASDIILNLDLALECPPLLLDQEQMQSAVENLINNAIDSMPHGGVLSIATHMAHRLQLPNAATPPGDFVLIEIKDSGTGMPVDIREKLFESHISYLKGSSGLGLAIVKKIVDDHNGFIDVESEEGAGSIFSIYLPIATAVEETRPAATRIFETKLSTA
ncbi:hypothetical protein JW998_00105 [candidate division KSB1 bacterium]|nr:hypothetical protein [candidate division KSB1 bacterium]